MYSHQRLKCYLWVESLYLLCQQAALVNSIFLYVYCIKGIVFTFHICVYLFKQSNVNIKSS